MASRYPSFDTRSSTSSQISDPSSSSEFRNPNKSSFKHTTMIGNSSSSSTDNSSRALIRRTKSSDLVPKATNKDQNLSSMVKKFMEKRSSSTKPKPGAAATPLFIPADFIAEDLKKTAAASSKASTFSSFHRKLFQNSSKPKKEVKALTEVKSNTRTLAMVLRSERELLNQNKDYEIQINELKLIMEDKNREVEKLKDLCLKQREEIKALKSAILFPDVMNTQLQGLLEKQGTELQQAKQVIPTLQRQVTSLTGQLQCLADDLAEVKADKYATRTCFEDLVNSPGTPIFDQEANSSLEFSSGDGTNPGSPDDMFLKDFNPCLTPYSTAKSKSKSKEFGQVRMMHGSPEEAGGSFGSSNTKVWSENYWQAGKISKSSEYEQQRPSRGNTGGVGAFRWSNDNNKNNNNKYGKPMQQKLF